MKSHFYLFPLTNKLAVELLYPLHARQSFKCTESFISSHILITERWDGELEDRFALFERDEIDGEVLDIRGPSKPAAGASLSDDRVTPEAISIRKDFPESWIFDGNFDLG